MLSHRFLGIGAESAVPDPGGWLAKNGCGEGVGREGERALLV